MANSIDDTLEPEHQAQGSQPAEGGLETRTRKSWGQAVGDLTPWEWTKIAILGTAGAAFGGGLLGFGALNVAATAGSYVGANYLLNRKKGFTAADIQTEAQTGSAITPLLYHLFQFLDDVKDPLTYAATYMALVWPFVIAVDATLYMIGKYTPSKFVKGIFKGEPVKDAGHIVKNSFTTWLKDGFKAALFFGPIFTALHYAVPVQYMIASVVPARVGFRYTLGKWQEKNDAPLQATGKGATALQPAPNYS